MQGEWGCVVRPWEYREANYVGISASTGRPLVRSRVNVREEVLEGLDADALKRGVCALPYAACLRLSLLCAAVVGACARLWCAFVSMFTRLCVLWWLPWEGGGGAVPRNVCWMCGMWARADGGSGQDRP